MIGNKEQLIPKFKNISKLSHYYITYLIIIYTCVFNDYWIAHNQSELTILTHTYMYKHIPRRNRIKDASK